MRVLLPVLVFALAGCSTLREPKPRDVDDAITAIKAPGGFKATADRIDAVRDLYYPEIRTLKNDVLNTGDSTTGLGIAAGIVAASTGVAGDVLKGIGLLAGTVGIFDLRYKPAQQRQYYLDAAQALGCMSDRVRQLDTATSLATKAGVATYTNLAETPAQVAAARNIDEARDIAYRDVLAVNRRLEEKLFAAVTTQSVSAIKDNLLKEAIAESKNADQAKTEPVSPQAANSLARTMQIEAAYLQKDAAATSQVNLVTKQLPAIFADGATFKTDMDACSAAFLK